MRPLICSGTRFRAEGVQLYRVVHLLAWGKISKKYEVRQPLTRSPRFSGRTALPELDPIPLPGHLREINPGTHAVETNLPHRAKPLLLAVDEIPERASPFPLKRTSSSRPAVPRRG